MRMLVGLLTILMACALGPAAAVADGAPFCLKGCDFGGGGGMGDCSFTSYQQCMATASGRDASCDANPSFRPAVNEMRTSGHVRMSRRRL